MNVHIEQDPGYGSLQSILLAYEADLERLLVTERDQWVEQSVQAHALHFKRLFRLMPNGDRIHVHRLSSGPPAPMYFHPHGQAAAVHVLGPGDYELGLGANDVLHARLVAPKGPWYYEMRTGAVQHYPRVLSVEPCYTFMVWTKWPTVVRGTNFSLAPLDVPTDAILDLVRNVLG